MGISRVQEPYPRDSINYEKAHNFGTLSRPIARYNPGTRLVSSWGLRVPLLSFCATPRLVSLNLLVWRGPGASLTVCSTGQMLFYVIRWDARRPLISDGTRLIISQ